MAPELPLPQNRLAGTWFSWNLLARLSILMEALSCTFSIIRETYVKCSCTWIRRARMSG